MLGLCINQGNCLLLHRLCYNLHFTMGALIKSGQNNVADARDSIKLAF